MGKVSSNPSTVQARPVVETAAETFTQGAQDARNRPSPDNRGDVRYPVSANAVVIDARSDTRVRGRAADISLSGCYLDAVSLFPIGASVGLRLTSEAHSFECEARVTYSLPGMGMGLVFTKTSPNQATELRHWIAELSGAPGATAYLVPEFLKKPSESGKPAGWQEFLSELIAFFRHKVLSRRIQRR